MKHVAIIGGGPAGLMAAEVLSQHELQVTVYDAQPSVGRKFLIAGKGGLNLTHAEDFETFVTRFGLRSETLRSLLVDLGPQQVREWCQGFGIGTFVGPSKRVFPDEMKAAPLLNQWLERLRSQNVTFETQHRWQGWDETGALLFETKTGPKHVQADAIVLALGGGSWAKLGSDGKWVSTLSDKLIPVAPLQPSNCGFEVAWSDHFREKFAGVPLKSVVLKFTNSQGETFQQQGAMVVSEYGLEGGLMYASSALVRDEILANGSTTIELDLAPDIDLEKLESQLSIPRGSRTISKHLKSKANLKGVSTGLLYEFVKDRMNDPVALAQAIKSLPIPLIAPRPIDEAISTAGGVRFEALDENLMVRDHPGLFCAGEMLDWEAPTGGYLLTACFASGKRAGDGVLKWLQARRASE